MSTPADILWRVNNEYRKRLTRLTNYLSLLEQLVISKSGGDRGQTLALISYLLEEASALVDEHREWRYRYYYESLDSKRMVQSESAVHRALARFSRMHGQHGQRLEELMTLLQQIQRPDPDLTSIPTGDLWDLAYFALNDLSGFDDYIRQYTNV